MATVPVAMSSTPRYVGADVRNYHRQRLVLCTCEACDGRFWCVETKARTVGGRYCSKRCAANAVASTGSMAGERNPRWLGGVSRDNMRYRRRQRERWPAKEAARRAVAAAISSGSLVRQPCACGEPKSEAHHHDYTKPLDVVWLCRKCHVAEHKRDAAR